MASANEIPHLQALPSVEGETTATFAAALPATAEERLTLRDY